MADFSDELSHLRAEHRRLINLLQSHGIAWQADIGKDPETNPTLSTREKIALFRRLFRRRSDVYALRWESNAGKSGYSPACGNEWKMGICAKPKITCANCAHRKLSPITDQVIFDYLSGRQTIGVYPLLQDDTCYFLAVDFDEDDWRQDARAFVQSCRELDIPAALEISRSGSGAHVWILFDHAIPARSARQLGTALISHTCMRTRQLKLKSYDRLYIEKTSLPRPLIHRLIRLAAFANPEFHQAQKLRLPVWNKPRIISCADMFPQHIALPRDCLDALLALLREHAIDFQLQDERTSGTPLEISFDGQLRTDQELAVNAMLGFDNGILCAPTAFGKMHRRCRIAGAAQGQYLDSGSS